MKKALIFSLFLSLFTFYGIQRNSDLLKEKFGITGFNPIANANYLLPENNKVIFLVMNETPECTKICFKVEGRLYCKSSEKTI